MGAESGSQRILDAMEKGTTVEQIAEATARLRAAGLRVGWFLQFGYPGETREELEATRRMVREHDPDELGISVSYPLPGSSLPHRLSACTKAPNQSSASSAAVSCGHCLLASRNASICGRSCSPRHDQDQMLPSF